MQHLVQTTRFGDITGENTIAKVAHCNTCGTDLDVSSVGTQTHLALRRLLEHVEAKHPELFEPLPIADELLPGCCTCCAAAIERQDPIGARNPICSGAPCSPLEECTPIVEGFSDPDGVPAARLLKDLPQMGLAAGSEWAAAGSTAMTYENVQQALDALNVQHELTYDGVSGLGIQWLQTGLMVGNYSLQILCPEDYYPLSGELLWSLQLFSYDSLEFLAGLEVSSEADEREVVLLALQLVFRHSERLKLSWKSCSKIEEVFS